MGYRSEVAIKCEHKAFELLMKACENGFMQPDSVLDDDGYKILYWDWVKWYSDFEEIKRIEKCMSWLNENHEPDSDDELGYHFLRLGEDGSDVEDKCNDYDIELYYVRQIELPKPLNENENRKQKVKNLIEEIKNGIDKTAEQIEQLLDEIL